MPKKVKELSAAEVRRLMSVKGSHAVGGIAGLYLVVTPPNGCSWILRVKVGDKRPEFGLGAFPEVSLADARSDAARIRKKIREGKDPLAKLEKKKKKIRSRQATKRLTLEEAAKQCFRTRAPEFKSRKHLSLWMRSLEIHVFPKIGNVDVADLTTSQIVDVLNPIWTTKTETATKIRQRLELIWSWAKVSGYCSGDNPVRWKGHLDQVLAAPNKIHKVQHHAALPWQDIPQFMADLRRREGMGAKALEFAILTAARSGEVRYATWEEVDLKKRLWTIPAERMKVSREHRVPLSEPAVAILKAQSNNLPYLFTAPKLGPLSDMSLSAVTRRMGVDAVPHGFRSTFKDWCRANTAYPDEISELALAHVNSDATRAAYARDDLLELRRDLMNEWGEYCD